MFHPYHFSIGRKQLNSRRSGIMWTRRFEDLRKFSLELTLEEIRRRAVEMGFELLEITTKDRIIRIPLRRIDELALVSE